MGSLIVSVVGSTINMIKSVLFTCLVAAASADADAAYLGYGYPYAYGYVPFGSSTGLDPITQGLDPVTQGYVPYYGYGYHGYYGKRSADAEADPALLYGAYGYGLPYAGYAYGAYPYAYGAYPYAYGAYGVPFGHPSGQDPITQGLITKRSADADAAVLYGAYGYPYAHAYVPFGSSSGLDPITQGLDAATQGYVPYYGYGHYAYGK